MNIHLPGVDATETNKKSLVKIDHHLVKGKCGLAGECEDLGATDIEIPASPSYMFFLLEPIMLSQKIIIISPKKSLVVVKTWGEQQLTQEGYKTPPRPFFPLNFPMNKSINLWNEGHHFHP